ncbi:MAG: ABC transporter ATP-binding protein [Anaerolineales bacterium]
MTNNPVIATDSLTVFYGSHRGIEDVNLTVERGEVFGFLGPNGAGKTTTQRALLDVIHPTNGQASIFGLDSQAEGPAIRQRVGYLPGEFSPYASMRARDFLDLFASLQGRPVDRGYRRQLESRLGLDTSRRIRQYSHGNKQKVGIVAAFMGRPDLLILDEPTIGLDPLVQQTVLELVREARGAGRTVFFSSHNLPEVQAVCDRVGIIREGRLIKTESVETLTRRQFKRVLLTLHEPAPPDAFEFEGVTETGRDGNRVMLEVRRHLDRVMERAVAYGIVDIDIPPVTLEEIFLAFYDRSLNGGDDA